jgi:hypothetical protein
MDTPVSMNLFGFTPRFLPRLESLLLRFPCCFSQGIPRQSFTCLGRCSNLSKLGLRRSGSCDSPETWFGLTYRADMDAVRGSLRQMVEAGVYPTSLRAPTEVDCLSLT